MPHPTAVGSTVKISLELEIIDIFNKIFQIRISLERKNKIIFKSYKNEI